jgi:predicted helicase
VIGFVTNAGFLEANTTDGLRKCLAEEFSNIYVFHLRGNQRTQGELSRKEGGKIFGSGSRAPIAISLLVKNPDAKQYGQIYWHDIGDYLSREEKLEKISSFASIGGITEFNGWQSITPDQHGDWISQRDMSFNAHIAMGDKSSGVEIEIFSTYSIGVLSNRDPWVYNSSKKLLEEIVNGTVAAYREELSRCTGLPVEEVEKRINRQDPRVKWSSDVIKKLAKGVDYSFDPSVLRVWQYRPFSKYWHYSSKMWNWSHHLMPRFFPTPSTENIVICVHGVGVSKEFSALASNILPEKQLLANGQCFPLYLYESTEESDKIDVEGTGDLFAAKASKPAAGKGGYTRRDAITDSGLKHFQDAYAGETISKEDLFYYVYGLLHSPDYRERYADNLSKELPRIPAVKTAKDFWHFSQAGRDLAELHLHYETVKPYPVKMAVAGKTALTDDDYRVEKMKYGKNGKEKDLSTLIYNHRITLTGIPLEAYDYVVNGKPALDWVVERQCVKTDKDSGIVNDANDWATETVGNAKYPLELFQRVITVSLETMKIVNGLPKLDI